MIVKNEEAVLARCLDSVREAVDEIIIVDTGSSDRTREIAREFTPYVFDFAWREDFSAARNFAFDQATMDYQMWLDADDVMPPDSLAKLLALKEALDSGVDMVTMFYHTAFDENGNPIHTSNRERLLKRARGFRWQDPVHECIPLSGNIVRSDIVIEHRKVRTTEDADRNLRIYQRLVDEGAALSPRQQYYYARELRDHGRWAEAAARFVEFLDGGQGWSEDNIAACHALGLCYKALGDDQRAMDAFGRSFRYGTPRAEVLCEIGYYHKAKGNLRVAAAWFTAVLALEHQHNGGFLLRDAWGYIPHLELCVCLYQLGDVLESQRHNELAGQCKPGSKAVESNRAFFKSRGLALPM
jgi:glycosyltransferase involved in cell wall biosynthesis